MQITGLGACYKCGKPASMAINLNANAAGGTQTNMVPACEDCHPLIFTVTQRENERLRAALRDICAMEGEEEIDDHAFAERALNIANGALAETR